MKMEDNVELFAYVDTEKMTHGIIDSLPSLFLIYLFAGFCSKKTDREKFNTVKRIEEFQRFGE